MGNASSQVYKKVMSKVWVLDGLIACRHVPAWMHEVSVEQGWVESYLTLNKKSQSGGDRRMVRSFKRAAKRELDRELRAEVAELLPSPRQVKAHAGWSIAAERKAAVREREEARWDHYMSTKFEEGCGCVECQGRRERERDYAADMHRYFGLFSELDAEDEDRVDDLDRENHELHTRFVNQEEDFWDRLGQERAMRETVWRTNLQLYAREVREHRDWDQVREISACDGFEVMEEMRACEQFEVERATDDEICQRELDLDGKLEDEELMPVGDSVREAWGVWERKHS